MTVLQLSFMGTVMIGCIALLRKIAGRRLPQQCYLGLWLLAGLRLLLPVPLASPFSIYNLWQRWAAASLKQAVPVGLPVWTDTAVVSPGPVSASQMPAFSWLLWLWLAGAAFCLLYLLRSHWQCRRWYAASLPVEDAFVIQWQNDHPLRRTYQIRRCQLTTTPLTYGLLRPVILLPDHQPLAKEQLQLVLLHEWQHIRHLDVLWYWFLLLLCSIHWFNPFVWLMHGLCRQDLELFCDEKTATCLPEPQRRQYAMLLLQQAASQTARTVSLFSSFSAAGYRCMEERIQIIMKQKQNKKFTMVLACLLLLGCGLCFATSATAAGQSGQGTQQLLWPVDSAALLADAEGAGGQPQAAITETFGERVHPVTGEVRKSDHICIGGRDLEGAAVLAAADGIVQQTGWDAQWGNYVIISHNGDPAVATHYRHCADLTVQQGQRVAAGQQIGTVGRTGMATGPCLSFAVYQQGVACDPLDYLETE